MKGKEVLVFRFLKDEREKEGLRVCGQSWTYIDDGLLAFNSDLELFLGELYYDVFAAEVGGDANRDVEVLDRLGPFVRQLGLLFCLSRAVFFVFLLALRGGGGARHDS